MSHEFFRIRKHEIFKKAISIKEKFRKCCEYCGSSYPHRLRFIVVFKTFDATLLCNKQLLSFPVQKYENRFKSQIVVPLNSACLLDSWRYQTEKRLKAVWHLPSAPFSFQIFYRTSFINYVAVSSFQVHLKNCFQTQFLEVRRSTLKMLCFTIYLYSRLGKTYL